LNDERTEDVKRRLYEGRLRWQEAQTQKLELENKLVQAKIEASKAERARWQAEEEYWHTRRVREA